MARGKRASFGSITRQDKDTWRLRWWADTPTGRRRVSETVHGSRRDAEHRLAEIHVEVGAERGGSITLGKAYERWWLPDAQSMVEQGRLSPRSLTTQQGMWRKYVEPRWGRVPIDEIRPLDLQDWLLTLGDQAASKSKSLMRQTINFAVLYEAAQRNVAANDYRMPPKAAKRDEGVYTLDGLRAVAEAVHGSPIEAAVLLAAFGSARPGESLGVKACEVYSMEVDGLTVALAPIVRQVDNNDGTLTDRLKTPQSKRVLALPGKVGARLLSIATSAVSEGLTWLCDDGSGRPFRQAMYLKLYKRALADAGAEYHEPSKLRNSWETYMHWTLGMQPEMIEKMMGHAARTVTAKHYDRPDDILIAEAVAKAYRMRPFAEDWDI